MTLEIVRGWRLCWLAGWLAGWISSAFPLALCWTSRDIWVAIGTDGNVADEVCVVGRGGDVGHLAVLVIPAALATRGLILAGWFVMEAAPFKGKVTGGHPDVREA